MALRKEEATKITFANDFSERTERKERNQYQQSDDAGREQVIEDAAADLSEGINDAAAMNWLGPLCRHGGQPMKLFEDRRDLADWRTCIPPTWRTAH
jgi:hypothetical protein